MGDRVKLTPLTPEEKVFAEENLGALEWCIGKQRLDEDLYDVAALGYLHAVKTWFARPDLRKKWTFLTIVNQTVRSYVGNERKAQERRIQTVSLDDAIPGTDDLTYGEIVTEENIKYLKGCNEGGWERGSTKTIGTASVELLKLMAFLDSDLSDLHFEFDDEKEADRKRSSFYSWRKLHKRDFTIRKRGKMVYVEKLDIRPKKGEK
ncbi:hypothetical protein [Lacrimispora sp.]|uniref:hypothetical protein n=1 Tax=Lacrimispora sp. TaxID=2719234 RepID=UPI0028ADDECE|nr:hypothetical protein [Lacrimispora sp.]